MSQLKLFDRQLTLDDKGGGKVIPLHRGKIKVKAIIYSDAEGYRDEKAPYMNKPYTTWTQANQAASSMAWFASHGKDGSKGGSDKTNFRIEWVDGETYDGRIDIDYTMRLNGRPLTDHVTQFVRFIAGIGKPPHLSETDYRNYVNRLERDKPGQTQSAIDFLQKYDLGNEAAVAHGHKPAGKTEYEKSRDEREAEEGRPLQVPAARHRSRRGHRQDQGRSPEALGQNVVRHRRTWHGLGLDSHHRATQAPRRQRDEPRRSRGAEEAPRPRTRAIPGRVRRRGRRLPHRVRRPRRGPQAPRARRPLLGLRKIFLFSLD